MKLTVAHLFPDLLNLYGDTGNITALSYRMEKRGIEADIIEYGIGDEIDFESADIVFLGGGSDSENRTVCEHLQKYRDKLKAYVEANGVLLAVCGGYQMLGKSYETDSGKIEGLSILNITSAFSKERLIGDIVIKSDLTRGTVVGFENHSGLTDIGDYRPFGIVLSGCGNNKDSGKEGIVYKNVIGTYLHGPLLPKNPSLTDNIIKTALKKRYGTEELTPLDDTLENLAHDYIVDRFVK